MSSNRLADKVALVTGASRGIGRALALKFAAEGASVIVAAKSVTSRESLPGSIHSVTEEIEAAGGTALAVRCDLRREDEIEAMMSATEERFGQLDIVVNNAGALWWRSLEDTPVKRFDLVMNVNLRGAYLVTRGALPLLRKAGGGHVVMCSPPIDLPSLPGKTAYLVSKFGQTMLVHGLSEELRGDGIAVNTLWPATAIESQATINYKLGTPRTWRKPSIMADAMMEMVTTAPADLTGRALLDEDFLRERGVTDFTRYRCDPDHEPPRLNARNLPSMGTTPERG